MIQTTQETPTVNKQPAVDYKECVRLSSEIAGSKVSDQQFQAIKAMAECVKIEYT